MGSYTKNIVRNLLGAVLALQLVSCAPALTSFPLQEVSNLGINKVSDGGSSGLDPITFCSPLSFDGISWNQDLNLTERRSMALALSISGAFEGSEGWSNITNNFDGMGLSAGLLNQTLGTDSLQPLLAEMEFQNERDFNASFSSVHLQSILSMLDSWKAGTAWKPKSLSVMMAQVSDRDAIISESEISEFSTTPHSASVAWAKNNLYQSNGSFIPTWKTEMQNLLSKPAYISLQVDAARRYHTKAMSYLQRIGIFELRAYLVMFDIVTQNGSIKESRFIEWAQKVKSQNLTSVASKLKLLVDLRLLDANPKWQADVRARKYTLIDGIGTVHGKSLNLTKSYCYAATDAIK
ncbi:MAG: hypothetical protein H7326_03310 [Bdellovibrionaceae bacterium]|nr:hypothetical protein [Pseudobdellovibrionaceae bacterium]